MVCAPVRRDNPRALARGLSTVQAHEPYSISLLPLYPVLTLHITDYLELKIGYLWIVVQFTDIERMVNQRCAKTGVPGEKHLTYRCRTWHLTCTPSEALTTAVRDLMFKSQRS